VIHLFHADSHFRADPDTILLLPQPLARVATDDPEEAFALTQHGVRVDGPWWAHPQTELLIRSTAVGDVLRRADGARLLVAPAGFVPYAPPASMTTLQQLIWARQKLIDARDLAPTQATRRTQEALVLLTAALDSLLTRPA